MEDREGEPFNTSALKDQLSVKRLCGFTRMSAMTKTCISFIPYQQIKVDIFDSTLKICYSSKQEISKWHSL